MKKRTQHNSVSEMVQSLSEDKSFAEEFAKRLSGRQLVKLLAVLRARAGLSQQELAEKLDCTQSKVSKLESSDDADIRFGDLVDYTEAVEHEMRVFLVPKGLGIVDEVKMHAFFIKRHLDRMVRLAGSDGVMAKGVADFLGEAAINLLRIVGKAVVALPPQRKEPSCPLHVEAPDMEADSTADEDTIAVP